MTRSRASIPTSPRTIYLVKMCELVIRAGIEQRLQDLEITGLQYTVLSIVYRGNRLSVSDIARVCRVTPQSMNELVVGLDEKGLLTRAVDPENRRILRIELTSVGRALFLKCDQLMDGLEDEIFAGLSKPGLSRLRRLLSKILDPTDTEIESLSAI